MIELVMSEKESNLENLNILLGVSGGIAAYKAVELASRLATVGARVNTIMTESACRFVGPKSFEAVTNSAVFTSLWEPNEPRATPQDALRRNHKPRHIALVDWADIFVVAPATANIIAKIANGICDDLLSTTVCARGSKPILCAPAMNNNMWGNRAVQQNVRRTREMGFEIIGPEKGRLASGTKAVGRMSEPQDILEAVEKIASKIKRDKK